jgi:hypothetical protein
MLDLKQMVKGKSVCFTHYKEGDLWYETEDGFAFPVPIEDIGNAKFQAKDKALLFMRYIRRHLNILEKAKSEADSYCKRIAKDIIK